MKISTDKKLARLVVTFFFVGILSACQAMPNKQSNVIVHDEYVSKGDLLPISTLTTIDGEVVDIHRLGKRKVIILFATWCDDSNRLLTALNASSIVNDESIEVIAIAREETRETVKAWRDSHKIKFAVATDLNRNVYKKFASGGIPRVITVGPNNKIIKMNLAEGEEQLNKIVWQ